MKRKRSNKKSGHQKAKWQGETGWSAQQEEDKWKNEETEEEKTVLPKEIDDDEFDLGQEENLLDEELDEENDGDEY